MGRPGALRALWLCGLVGLAVGLPGEAPWGNAWTDGAGELTSTIAPLRVFYDCSVDMVVYPSMAACTTVCPAGECTMQTEEAVLETAPSSAGGPVRTMVMPGILLGVTVNITVVGATVGAQVSVMEDPGLPVGMVAYPRAGGGLLLSWTPRALQLGRVHEVSLTSVNGADTSVPWVISIPVLSPALQFLQPEASLVGESAVPAVVGTPSMAHLQCLSNYPAALRLVDEGALPKGVRAEPFVDMRHVQEGQQFPPESLRLVYHPEPGMEGALVNVCYNCTALHLSEQRCVTFRTEVCKYTTEPGDSLMSLTRRFFFSSNWRRLWNVNSDLIPDPDVIMGASHVLTLGPVFMVQPGDTVDVIAARFHTTAKNLLALNPHIASADMISAGMHVCIPSCTMSPNPSKDYIHPW